MLYPPTPPRASGFLQVDDSHQIYWEESGNPDGCPVVVLHGGPGAAAGALLRRWFDARVCRVITFDQRGCGRSMPFASVVANTTQHLLADIEMLRRHLDVAKWIVWGHSWGATLALAYAERSPLHVGGLVLCSPFTATADEFEWIYGGGAGDQFPRQWFGFRNAVDSVDNAAVVDCYARVLHRRDPERSAPAAAAWCAWEDFLAGVPAGAIAPTACVARSRAVIGAHFARHQAFLADGELLDRLPDIPAVPIHVVHGVDDHLVPVHVSEAIQARLQSAHLLLVNDAGHDPSHPDLMAAIVKAGEAVVYESLRTRTAA
jgi:proline iminopeptidase